MRSLRTLVGFVLILGLLTLGVVGLEYLQAPMTLQLAFAVLLAAFGFITFGIAVMSRPSAGSLLAMAAAAIALFVGVRGSFTGTLDLLLFSLVIFDVIVLFVLFGEIDHERLRRRAMRASKPSRAPRPVASRSAQNATAKAPAAQTSSAKAAKPAKTPARTTSAKRTRRSTRSSPAKRSTRKARTTKPAARKTSTRRSSPASSRRGARRFVASRDRKGSAFHLVNCYLAQRIDDDAKAHFATREAALEAGHRPCRVCNP